MVLLGAAWNLTTIAASSALTRAGRCPIGSDEKASAKFGWAQPPRSAVSSGH